MSNNKLKKKIIPQKVFDLRRDLIDDFFHVYECETESLKVIQLSFEPDYPATVEQMAKTFTACNKIWCDYIDRFKLPKTLKPTFENILKKEWEAKGATAPAIPKHQRAGK